MEKAGAGRPPPLFIGGMLPETGSERVALPGAAQEEALPEGQRHRA